MGRVWRAVHVDLGLPAAVKIMSGRRTERLHEALRAEVRSGAALCHPAILQIYDHGTIRPEEDRDSGGRVRAGRPWMAMELASGGQVDPLRLDPGWDGALDVLVTLLDALSHAHARGVVHRDLKPSNLLRAGPADLRPGMKLADFGISTAGVELQERRVIGTPRYMAPEMFRGDPRDIGPWSDLYAVGCLGWELTTGRPPFQESDPTKLALHHLYDPPPALRPRIPSPPDLEGWLRRLLAKDPHDRFLTAADAAWALAGLEQPRAAVLRSERRTRARPDVTLDLGDPATGPVTLADLLVSDHHATAEPDDIAPPMAASPPPLPDTWRQRGAVRCLPAALAAAPNLYGVRSVPIVGRERERTRMWELLREVHQTGRPRVALLRGPQGVGRSAVARWLAERAEEAGAVTALRVQHGKVPGPGDGPGPAFARWLRLQGLPWEAAVERARRVLRRFSVRDTADAVEIASLSGDVSTDPGGWSSEERFALYQRLLGMLARGRPALVLVEDCTTAGETIDWLRWLVESDEAPPVLAVLAAPSHVELPSLQPLLGHPAVEVIAIDPLDDADMRDLVDALIGLEAPLAERVVRQARGFAGYAVQLVSDWVDRGALVPGPDGFTVIPSEAADLPVDVPAIGSRRLERLLLRRPWWWRTSLEIAAALGEVVRMEEWIATCAAAGLPSPRSLAERIIAEGLAVPVDGGWRFSHPLLHGTIAQGARDAGRWSTAHRACARMIQAHDPPHPGRAGHHLLSAGDHEGALVALLEQARRHLLNDEARLAARVVDEAEVALLHLSPRPSDGRRGVLGLLQARIHKTRSELDDAEHRARDVEEQALTWSWTRLEAEALAELADIARIRGDLQDALPRLQRVLLRYLTLDDEQGIADTRRSLASVHLALGEGVIAWRMLQDARVRYESQTDRLGAAMCLAGLGDVARSRGRWDEASNRYRAALATFGAMRHRSGIALALHGLAELDRLTGRLEEAQHGYRQVMRLDTDLGRDNTISRLNLALCLIEAGDVGATRALDDLEQTWTDQGRPTWIALVHVAWLPLLASRGDWVAFEDRLRQAQELLASSRLVEVDVARLATLAGERCAELGHAAQAREAWTLALGQWRALGNVGQAREVEERLTPAQA
jgi:tetratricopeptide (TPR) repeat protein